MPLDNKTCNVVILVSFTEVHLYGRQLDFTALRQEECTVQSYVAVKHRNIVAITRLAHLRFAVQTVYQILQPWTWYIQLLLLLYCLEITQ